MKHRSLFLLMTALAFLLTADTQVSVSVSSTSATVGERINLKFIIRTPEKTDSIRISGSSPEFEILEEPGLIRSTAGEITTLEQNRIIAFFKTGNFQVGPFQVQLIRDGEVTGTADTNVIPVTVRSVLEETDRDIRPLRDLREIRGNPFYVLKYLLLLILLLLAAAGLIRLVKMRRRRTGPPPPPPVPPDEELITRIGSLWRTGLLASGKVKPFFKALTEIYKTFMTRFYGFNAEDLTSYEISNQLSAGETDSGMRERFGRIFLISDLAKFARYTPPEEEVEEIRSLLLEVAETARKRRVKKEEEERNAAL